MKLQRVLLSRIDLTTDGWDDYILELHPTYVDRLALSFQRVGQVYPFLLLKDMQWLFIIAGYSKYLAMKKLGVEEAWARVYQKNELSREQVLWLAVEEKCGRILSDGARSRTFKQFKKLCDYSMDRLVNEVAPALGMEPSEELVRRLLEMEQP